MKETLDNSQSFEPGDLMEWQDMSKAIRELLEWKEIIRNSITKLGEAGLGLNAHLSDHATRLDTLEEQMGQVSPNWFCSEEEAKKHDELEQMGTHPPNCRCAWCEPGDGNT